MKRIMKAIIAITIIMTMFIGCGISENTDEYTRNTDAGVISPIGLVDALNLANEDKDSIILFTLESCPDCTIMKDILVPYLEEHYLEINEVNLSSEGSSTEEVQNNREKINTIFKEFNSVPSMYYVKDGEVIDGITYITEEEQLEAWVVKNELDKK